MSEQRVNGHKVSNLSAHIVWSTKYRYSILEGVVSKDRFHMHIEYYPSQDISYICLLNSAIENSIAIIITFIGKNFIGYGYSQTIQAFRKYGKN